MSEKPKKGKQKLKYEMQILPICSTITTKRVSTNLFMKKLKMKCGYESFALVRDDRNSEWNFNISAPKMN